YDTELYLNDQTSKQTNLPSGRKELLESTYILVNHQLNKLTLDIECETQKALELYQNCWLHLPLSICRLAEKYGWEFAQSYAYIVLKMPWISVPSLRELCYMKFIELDIENGDFNDFGLFNALKNPMFNCEFHQFI
ncbi:24571_t:CDS:2, partial [Racocetra persica]